MEEKLEASIEIIHFGCDIITTSSEHDNGYVDDGDLARILEDIANKVRKML